jgi:hypothetical protein
MLFVLNIEMGATLVRWEELFRYVTIASWKEATIFAFVDSGEGFGANPGEYLNSELTFAALLHIEIKVNIETLVTVVTKVNMITGKSMWS